MSARWDYWNGPDEEDRREKYKEAFLPEYQGNGDAVQQKIAAVVTAFRAETGIELPEGYSSGWRSPTVNESTANAGKKSTHLQAKAGDKRDTPNGDFAWWCVRNPHVLEQHGLWMEHPVATVLRAFSVANEQKREATPWCHLQVEAPGSGLRIYFPDSKAKPEWDAFLAAGGQPGTSYTDWKAAFAPRRTSRKAAEHEQ